MLSRKLTFLQKNMCRRAVEQAPLSPAEMLQLASVLHGLAIIAEQLEDKPVPPAYRLIRGGLDMGGAA